MYYPSDAAELLRGPEAGIVQMNEDDIVDSGVVAGIDVGGKRKGCHLVILHGTRIFLRVKSSESLELLDACLAHGVQVVGIDAPCLWSHKQADAGLLNRSSRVNGFSASPRLHEKGRHRVSSTVGCYAVSYFRNLRRYVSSADIGGLCGRSGELRDIPSRDCVCLLEQENRICEEEGGAAPKNTLRRPS
jgi:hypothetical protein